MWLAALAGRLPARLMAASFVENAIDRCEMLERLPTRDRTAYYVALRAVKDYAPGLVTATKNAPNSTGVSESG